MNKFGADKENLILADNNGKKLNTSGFSLKMKRGRPSYFAETLIPPPPLLFV
ncbi:MAG: hypothetical protein LBJ03_02715 [Holosporales bacterium]|jgi:hypothetical protein|nr:hypothetical protein [Holosporales bacterium]